MHPRPAATPANIALSLATSLLLALLACSTLDPSPHRTITDAQIDAKDFNLAIDAPVSKVHAYPLIRDCYETRTRERLATIAHLRGLDPTKHWRPYEARITHEPRYDLIVVAIGSHTPSISATHIEFGDSTSGGLNPCHYATTDPASYTLYPPEKETP